MSLNILIKFIISLLLGSVIGLERESDNSHSRELWTLGGVRTFALISFLGAFSGFLYIKNHFVFSSIITVFVFAFILIYYFITAFKASQTGFTTEISAVFSYLIGFILLTQLLSIPFTIALSVVLVALLSIKSSTKKFASDVDKAELRSFISFGIVALVVLPFLPDVNFRLIDISSLNSLALSLGRFGTMEIINPHKLWLIVVLISGLNLLNYAFRKKLGEKTGLFFSSLFSGFLSSTIFNTILSDKSKKASKNQQEHYAIASLIAYCASMVHVLFLIAIGNISFFWKIFPLLSIVFLTSILIIVFKTQKHKENLFKDKLSLKFKEKPSLYLLPAINFVLFIIGVKILIELGSILLGNVGFFATSILSSIIGTDAVIINLSDLAFKTITFNYAALIILLVNAGNLLSKWVYTKINGGKTLCYENGKSFLIITVVSFLAYFLLF